MLQLGVRAHFLQELKAGHRLHVPVGNDKAVAFLAHLLERHAAIGGFIDIVEADLFQQIADDPEHRAIIIDDEDIHVHIDAHSSPRFKA